jgi:hypothetical protein
LPVSRFHPFLVAVVCIMNRSYKLSQILKCMMILLYQNDCRQKPIHFAAKRLEFTLRLYNNANLLFFMRLHKLVSSLYLLVLRQVYCHTGQTNLILITQVFCPQNVVQKTPSSPLSHAVSLSRSAADPIVTLFHWCCLEILMPPLSIPRIYHKRPYVKVVPWIR